MFYDDLVQKAENIYLQERYEDIEEIYKDVMQSDLTEARIYLARAFTNWGISLMDEADQAEEDQKENYVKEAIEKYQEALKLDPSCPVLYNNYAYALVILAGWKKKQEKIKLLSDAVKNYRQAVEIDSTFTEAFNDLGSALYELARLRDGKAARELIEEAVVCCHHALRLKPDDARACCNLGRFLVKNAELTAGYGENDQTVELYEQAIAYYNEAIHLNPFLASAFYYRGYTYYKLSQKRGGVDEEKTLREAVKDFQQAAELQPKDLHALSCWGITLLQVARYHEGVHKNEWYQQALAVFSREAEMSADSGSYNIACVYALMGDVDQSLHWLQKAIQVSPQKFNYQMIMEDSDFSLIRNNEVFQKMLRKYLGR